MVSTDYQAECLLQGPGYRDDHVPKCRWRPWWRTSERYPCSCQRRRKKPRTEKCCCDPIQGTWKLHCRPTGKLGYPQAERQRGRGYREAKEECGEVEVVDEKDICQAVRRRSSSRCVMCYVCFCNSAGRLVLLSFGSSLRRDFRDCDASQGPSYSR